MKKLIALSLLSIVAFKAEAKCPCIDTAKFNDAYTALDKSMNDIAVKTKTVYVTNHEGDTEERVEYKYKTATTDAEIALGKYEYEYDRLMGYSTLSNLATGSTIGILTAIAKKTIGTKRMSKEVAAATVGACSVGSVFAINAMHPTTPYYALPSLTRNDNFFSNKSISLLPKSLITIVGSAFAYIGTEIVLNKIKG